MSTRPSAHLCGTAVPSSINSPPTQPVQLYYAPGACSLAAHIALHHAGLPHELLRLSVRPEGFLSWYTSINPKMRVPALVLPPSTINNPSDAPVVITEITAVVTAISQLSPSTGLLGKTPLDTLRVYEWFNWLSGELHGQAFGALFRPERFIPFSSPSASEDHEKLREQGKLRALACYETIESRLAESGDRSVYAAVGDAFTAVDAFLFVFWRWGKRNGIDMEGKYVRYRRLVREGVWAIEATGQAMKEEGLEADFAGDAASRI
jgi:glutathione S-transferase